MKILMTASEAAPFIKSGGLGDVVGSLPKALNKLNCDVRVVLPKYQDIPYKYKKELKHIKNFNVQLSWRNLYCGIEYCEWDNVKYYFVDNEYYFKRSGIYGYYDEGERFAFFSRAVLEMLKHIDFYPDIIHCNDWQTALIPVLIKEQYKEYNNIKTVFTIHNLKYQGIFGAEVLEDVIGLNNSYANNKALEFNGAINTLKAAIYYSDVVTTVSPTYAGEIQNSFFGENLNEVLNENNYKLFGVLNGLDYEIFDPSKDPNIAYKYTQSYNKKLANKNVLQAVSNLPQRKEVPVLSFVSRLVKQKGLDLIFGVIDDLMSMDIQLVILGIGDPYYENLFRELECKYPEKVKAFVEFDVGLAQKIYAGSDIFLMPSLFEPCGLSQLIALKYGAIPVVRGTGGLRDTIEPYNQYTNQGTGFSFDNYNAHEFLFTVQDAVSMYYNEKEKWIQMFRRVMKADFSWEKSAKEYLNLYKKIS